MRLRERSWCVTTVTLALASMLSVACGDDKKDNNGSTGPTHASLNGSRSEPPGANCRYGGTANLSGSDNDDDGVLDADEVTATTYACNDATTNDGATVTSQAELDALADVNIVNGDLKIAGGTVTNLSLAKLERVTGNVIVTDNAALTAIAFPRLVTVDGSVDIDGNGAVTSIALPVLTTVGTHCVVTAASTTTSINLAALTRVGTDFALHGGGSNAAVTLHPPRNVGQDMTIDGLTLSALAFDAGSSVVDLSISNNGQLTSLTANGPLTVGGKVYVTDNRTLASAVASTFAAATSATASNRVIKGNAP